MSSHSTVVHRNASHACHCFPYSVSTILYNAQQSLPPYLPLVTCSITPALLWPYMEYTDDSKIFVV